MAAPIVDVADRARAQHGVEENPEQARDARPTAGRPAPGGRNWSQAAACIDPTVGEVGAGRMSCAAVMALTIDQALDAFLDRQRQRLSSRTMHNYEQVVDLLHHSLNGYAVTITLARLDGIWQTVEVGNVYPT